MLLAKYDTNDALLDRRAMVEDLLERGIRDERVLEAFLVVPRHDFLPGAFGKSVYQDFPLPIGHQQTSSPPYLVARLLETLELRPLDRVLEIGTGSGFQAAVLSLLCNEVITVELVPELADAAEARLRRMGCWNVQVVTADGCCGLPEYGRYDAIVIAAGASCIPSALLAQLRGGGHLVVPEGEGDELVFRRYREEQNDFAEYATCAEFASPPPLWHTFVPVVPRTRGRQGDARRALAALSA